MLTRLHNGVGGMRWWEQMAGRGGKVEGDMGAQWAGRFAPCMARVKPEGPFTADANLVPALLPAPRSHSQARREKSWVRLLPAWGLYKSQQLLAMD